MIDWLLDTLLWTGALIALVLVLRRPVARWFGSQFAYALWALPLLRLVTPPLILPAWMAPEEQAATTGLAQDFSLVFVAGDVASPATQAGSPIPFSAIELALAVWLGGAAIFLARRFRAYHRMRIELLGDAREVGRVGRVRLVETRAADAPLAFGVCDKVVALPNGFLAAWDREARDLALAHELEHHRGHDLLINMAAQPLFALHWFNPLGHLGWLAMRRDQEAACDARVIRARSARERAAYAKVIASFATGPNVALAAPMACPVLGEKSIIQRLRSIRMHNPSNRQRWLGRGVLATALIALPLTASIGYAEDADAPLVMAPASPAAPSAPLAPTAPATPSAPAAVAWQASVQAPDAPEAEDAHKVIIRREVAHDVESDGEGREVRKIRRVHIDRDGEPLSKEEMKKIMAEVRAGLAEADVALAEANSAHRIALARAHGDMKHATVIEITCDDGSKGKEVQLKDGKQLTRLCTSEIMASALEGLRSAREEISQDAEIPSDVRASVLEALDEKISEWEGRKAG